LRPPNNKLYLFLLPFALCGFAVAQPVYNLLLQTPVFLAARQNTPLDVWALVLTLSFVLPLVLALPAWLLRRHWPIFSLLWCWLLSSGFAALFMAQLLQQSLGGHWILFLGLSLAIGAVASWILLVSRWSALATVLAALAIVFPLWFLLFSPVLEQVDNFAVISPDRQNPDQALPDIVFVILDELPLATLLDNNGQVDESLFPGFARLQSMSDWYFNTTSVSDSTGAAVPAILTSRYPGKKGAGLTVAKQPVNLFTILRHHYQYNVAEAVTRYCPQSLCPRTGPGHYNRFKALLLDLSAIYLHRVVPQMWETALPPVTNHWSGFFAERQVFFPDGWLKHAGAQTEIDRPGYFNSFTDSIKKRDKPVLNFLHILFPHEPNAYLSNGENYGLAWMRGQYKELWGDVGWGVISGKQRHYLQVQYADHLLNRLFDHLQEQQLLNDSMVVVLADHGISFALNDTRRALSDINKAALLRVPLFIKQPGQVVGRRIDRPAMTIDILPTMLATLGFSIDSMETDGIDLRLPPGVIPRGRYANSHLQRELRVLDEADLDLDALVAETRAQLALDRPGSELWEVGPYDHLRGQDMAVICDRKAADFAVGYDGFKPLPNTDPGTALPAYVVGTFTGPGAPDESRPFLITSNEQIVASGHTWELNGRSIFFALVEPPYLRQDNWKPEAWLLAGHQCFGDLD